MVIMLLGVSFWFMRISGIIFKFDLSSLTQGSPRRRYIAVGGDMGSNQKHVKYLICTWVCC